jgi:hypothetical protein
MGDTIMGTIVKQDRWSFEWRYQLHKVGAIDTLKEWDEVFDERMWGKMVEYSNHAVLYIALSPLQFDWWHDKMVDHMIFPHTTDRADAHPNDSLFCFRGLPVRLCDIAHLPNF